MIAVTYLEGWMLAHPAPVLIFIACCAIAAVYVLYMHAENRRDDREDGLPEAPRRGPRSRARGTRARRHAFLGSACRRARATITRARRRFLAGLPCRRARATACRAPRWWRFPLARWYWMRGRADIYRRWSRGRQAIALRVRGITTDMLPIRGDAQGRDVPARAPTSGPAARADVTGSLSPRPPEEGPRAASAPLPGATREPARLAAGAERDALVLDYQPAAPFADCLSDETIARGMPAVQ